MAFNAFHDVFLAAQDKHPHLLFDIGFNRVSGYVVAVWDAKGCDIKDAPKIVSIEGSRDGNAAMLEAGLALLERFDLYCDVDLAPFTANIEDSDHDLFLKRL